jgi:molybdopterin-guanine dinucleotide biosynthesis protein A
MLLSEVAGAVAVAAPHKPVWLAGDFHLITDEQGIEGPLAGLIAGLRWAEAAGAGGLLVLAVDLPRLDSALLRSLVTGSTPTCGVVCRTQWGYEPLCASYPPGALACAVEMAQAGERKLQNLVARLVEEGAMKVRNFSESETFFLLNINTPGDWTA